MSFGVSPITRNNSTIHESAVFVVKEELEEEEISPDNYDAL
jgi:hypothetical protein